MRTVDTWALAVRDQSPLYQKDRVRMAGYCWPSMCGGSLAETSYSAWRAVLSDWVEEPNPVHGPGESS